MIFRRNEFLSCLLAAVCAAAVVGVAYAAERKLWECSQCGEQRWDDSKPESGTCPDKKTGGHIWVQQR
jgi:hypothetical protein